MNFTTICTPDHPKILTKKFHPLFFTVVFPVSVFFVVVAWSPPLLFNTLAEWSGSYQKALLSFVCHQQLSRTWLIGEVPLAVCSRCTGIYTGLLVGLVIFSYFSVWVNKSVHMVTRFFFVSTLILAGDGFANLFKIWQTPDYLRTLIGGFWGAVIGIMLVTAMVVINKHK